MSDVEAMIVLGSGPAGLSAALYAARALKNPLLIAGPQPGGQLTVTTDVENYPGFPEPILGPELTDRMRLQAERAGTRFASDVIERVDFSEKVLRLYGLEREYAAHTVVIATGAQARWLNVPGEVQFRGFGVSACAVCDGFFFRGKAVAVVGGGNTAVEEALYLSKFAKKVWLIHRRDRLRAEPVLQRRLFDDPKIEPIWNAEVVSMHGTIQAPPGLTHARLQDTLTGAQRDLPLDGLFVAIGHVPATAPFVAALDCDADGYIRVPPGGTTTSVPGVFAAGDVADRVYRQAVTAAGTGCMAALDAVRYLEHAA